MAFSGMGSNGGGRGRSRFRGGSSISEMNVVPLVDVVLVLLIIFMVTASAFEFGLEIDVPQITTTRTTAEELPIVSVDRGGKTWVNDQPVNLAKLGEVIKRRFAGKKEVYVKADKELTLDTYFQVLDALGKADFDVKVVAKAANIPSKQR